MSYDQLLRDIESAEEQIGSSTPGFNVNDFLLGDKEVVKNLISSENPSMSKEDVDLMTEGFNILGDNTDSEPATNETGEIPNYLKKNSESEEELANLSELGDTPFKKKLIDDTIETEVNNQSQYPLTGDSPYYKKAKDLKLTMKQKIGEFVRKVIELVKEIAFAVVTIGTSIPGGVGMLAPFAFNVPGMITMILDIIMLLLNLKSKALDALSIFPFFSSLVLLCSPGALEVISSILSKLYKILKNSILSVLLAIEDFIKRAIGAIKRNTSADKEGRRARSIARKLRELEYLPNNNFTRVNDDDVDEIENILENWKVVKTGRYIDSKKEKATLGEVERIQNFEDLLKELDNLEDVVINVKDVTGISGEFEDNVEETIVFDVELPNGEKIIGLTEEEVEGLRSTYNVIFSDDTKFFEADKPNNISPRI